MDMETRWEPVQHSVVYQVVEDAFVQSPLIPAALPQLLVVVVEALPVAAELLQTVRVDVLDPA